MSKIWNCKKIWTESDILNDSLEVDEPPKPGTPTQKEKEKDDRKDENSTEKNENSMEVTENAPIEQNGKDKTPPKAKGKCFFIRILSQKIFTLNIKSVAESNFVNFIESSWKMKKITKVSENSKKFTKFEKIEKAHQSF